MRGVPPGLVAQGALGPDWQGWLDRLPRLRDDLLAEWSLRVDGTAMHGWCSLVVPVLTEAGERTVLKLTFDGDDESEHEALALRHWDGRGAVRMLRADPARRALLLERLHTTDLGDTWDIEACEVVAGLWSSLHLPALAVVAGDHVYVERRIADPSPLPSLYRAGPAPDGRAGHRPFRDPGGWPTRPAPSAWRTATCTTPTCSPRSARRGSRSTRSR